MNKIIWVLRGQLYGLIFRAKILYLGRPLELVGIRRLKASNYMGLYPLARIEIGKKGNIIIGNNFRAGHSLFMQTNSLIEIGNNVTVSANVFIGTTDYNWREKSDQRLKNRKEIEKPIFIGDNVFIGVGAVILPGTKLSSGCVVGANVVAKGDYREHTIIR